MAWRIQGIGNFKRSLKIGKHARMLRRRPSHLEEQAKNLTSQAQKSTRACSVGNRPERTPAEARCVGRYSHGRQRHARRTADKRLTDVCLSGGAFSGTRRSMAKKARMVYPSVAEVCNFWMLM